MIPFKILPIGEAEIEAVSKVIASRRIGMGEVVKELEKEFASYVGANYAIAVDSCTSALFLALKYCAIDNNGLLPIEVSIPSMTVPLVANTICHANGRIRFVDEVDWVGHNYQLSPYPIIDSAHEVTRDQYRMHNPNTMICYSFYPTKPITSCEGGMIATNDDKAVEWVEKARFYGRNNGDAVSKNSWEYDIEFPGWKMNMTEIQAAIALVQLRKLPELTARRQAIVDQYNELLGEHNTSLYLYRIRVKNRDEFIRYMKFNEVECGIHFKPLHWMTPYKRYSIGLGNTDIVGRETVSLPSYDSLSRENVEYIAGLVKGWKKKNG